MYRGQYTGKDNNLQGDIKDPRARRSVSACATTRWVPSLTSLRKPPCQRLAASFHCSVRQIGANVTISVLALSVIVNYHPCAEPTPTDPGIRYTLDYSKAIPPPKNMHSRTELLHSFCVKGSAPILLVQSNTRETQSHLSNKALVLGPSSSTLRLSSICQRPRSLNPPILFGHPSGIRGPLSRLRHLHTAYPSNRLPNKHRVH